MSTHYFSAHPASDDDGRRRELNVTIGGRDLVVATAAGVFSGDGLDHATALLLDELATADRPDAPKRVLDLGCGWGPICLGLGLRWPTAEIWAVDVNERALTLSSENTARHGITIHARAPEAVPADLRFDEIWSNPPIRIGKAALHELLLRWLSRLEAGGCMTMVVGKNLGADSLQRWLTERGWPTERIGSAKGFRLLRTIAPPQ